MVISYEHSCFARNTTLLQIAGAKSLRLKSKKLFYFDKHHPGFGTNLQNIEKSARRNYEADPGKLLAQNDQSGADAFIVAYLMRNGNALRELFTNRIKIHNYLAVMFPEQWIDKFPHAGEFRNIPISQLKSDPRWPEFAKAVAKSDDNPPATRYYYHYKKVGHCLTEDHEVLTKDGWIRIDQWNNQNIAVWNPDTKGIWFEQPSSYIQQEYKGELFEFEEAQFSQSVTPNHRMCYKGRTGKHLSTTADIFSDLKQPRVPVNGYLIDGLSDIKEDEARFIAAIQADAEIMNEWTVRFKLKRQRKIWRLYSILQALGLQYKTTYHSTEVCNITVYDCQRYISIFEGNKVFDKWLLTFSQKALAALCYELCFWDGRFSEEHLHKREDYISAHKQNIDWIKTALHLVGKQGTVNKHGEVWECGINQRQYARINSSKKIHHDGFVYCFTVSTSHFLVRRNGKISVSMNSANYGAHAGTLIDAMLLDSEGQVRLTKKQGEDYLRGYHSLIPQIRGEFHKYIEYCYERDGYLRTLQGFPIYLNQKVFPTQYSKIYDKVPQATVAVITHNAIIAMQDYIEEHGLDWDILTNTHDSFLVQAPGRFVDGKPEGEVLECARLMKKFMEQTMTNHFGESLTMRSESQVGKNWAPYKEGFNDFGLRAVELS